MMEESIEQTDRIELNKSLLEIGVYVGELKAELARLRKVEEEYNNLKNLVVESQLQKLK